MPKIFSLIVLCLTGLSSFAQKQWDVVIKTNHHKVKGRFENVSDSGVVIGFSKNRKQEVSFSEMKRILIRRSRDETAISIIALAVGGITGGVVIGTSLSDGKSGEPAALAGVVGGIVGGLVSGLVSAISAPEIIKLFARKIKVEHSAQSYVELQKELVRYTRY
jgi:hypothetical protein